MANTFIEKYKGVEYLILIIENNRKKKDICEDVDNYLVRSKAAAIIGTLAQNNEIALSYMYRSSESTGGNVMERLLQTYDNLRNSDAGEDADELSKNKLRMKVP